jgi:hypothetical protein
MTTHYEKLTLEMILNRIESDTQLSYSELEEGPEVLIVDAWSHIFSVIEQCVFDVIANKQRLTLEKKVCPRVEYWKGTRATFAYFKAFYEILDAFEYYDLNKKPSPYVVLYFDVLRTIIKRNLAEKELDPESYIFKERQVIYNEFVAELFFQATGKKFRQVLYGLRARSTQNFNSAKRYFNGLFDHSYSKLLVLRLDLLYLSKFANSISEEEARADLKHFFNNRRSNKLFKHWVGYIAKLEYGVKKGFHFHLIVFLDGQHVKSDRYIAGEIGKYWQGVVTKGRGFFFNCNAKAFEDGMYAYKRVGIGMINHDDVNKRHILLYDVITYLCKKGLSP